MKFSVITLFPELIAQYCRTSIIGRAVNAGKIQFETVNPRAFTQDVHRKVDDAPYGGGPGMVMMCQPVMDAYESLLPLPANTKVLMTSPLGQPFNQAKAQDFARHEQLVILCGHYEGIDFRVNELIPSLELVSVGDFVMTGGELAALCIIDATARLLPGVLGKDASAVEESFSGGVLEYPHYTRPAVYRGLEAPPVLLSGNHAAIAQWRREMALRHTLAYRPDMLAQANLTEKERAWLETQMRAQGLSQDYK